MFINPLHFFQSKFLHDEEKIMKSVSKPTFKNITRYRDYSQIEYVKKKIEYDSPVYVGVTILELSKLHMYDVFYNILKTIPQRSNTSLYGYGQFHIKL